MPPSNCFRTGRRSLTQSSVKAVHGQDSKWMSGSVYHRNRRREARTRAEGPEKPISPAPPERVRRDFALLTITHHGSRATGLCRATLLGVHFRKEVRGERNEGRLGEPIPIPAHSTLVFSLIKRFLSCALRCLT